MAAHDLQEPARTLESYAGFLREDINAEALDGEAATDLRFIEEAAQRLRSYINDLLALSRAGSQALSRQRVPIESCVSSSLKALQQRVDTAQAQLTYGQLPEVIGDRRLITILFENLISNALKFSGETPPAIEVTAYTSGEMWTLGVRDNGIGLEEEHAQDVFEPFRRLHGLTEYPGSGMGLAVSRKIVERHGGRNLGRIEGRRRSALQVHAAGCRLIDRSRGSRHWLNVGDNYGIAETEGSYY